MMSTLIAADQPKKTPPVVAKLAPLTGEIVINEPLTALPLKPWMVTKNRWSAKDGGVWGAQKKGVPQGAALRAPLGFADGTVQYEVQFKNTGRHSLRVECGERKQSFRIEISRTQLGIIKNPDLGEAKDQIEPLARKPLKLEANRWYPVRITFKGNKATAEVNGVTLTGEHALIGTPKEAMNMLVFGDTAGFRNVTAAK
ncbi:MAG: Arylsulfatase [Verrucomicrobiaceae bacterium]|nr:Arylsulfatase [Verrucomicrobiaceae bacterium]